MSKYYNNVKIFRTKDRVRIKVKNIYFQKIIKKLKKFSEKREITFWFSYGINLTEMYEDNVRAFTKWIKNIFGINVKVAHHGTKNAWRVDFDNKIISRYFIKFFGFPVGVKTYTVKEPHIIKISSLRFRKCFLLGLIMFDGYTRSNGKAIGFSSKSKILTESVYDILTKLDIPIKDVVEDNYGRFICESRVLDKINLKKAQGLFEKNTEKWFRIEKALKKINNN